MYRTYASPRGEKMSSLAADERFLSLPNKLCKMDIRELDKRVERGKNFSKIIKYKKQHPFPLEKFSI